MLLIRLADAVNAVTDAAVRLLKSLFGSAVLLVLVATMAAGILGFLTGGLPS